MWWWWCVYGLLAWRYLWRPPPGLQARRVNAQRAIHLVLAVAARHWQPGVGRTLSYADGARFPLAHAAHFFGARVALDTRARVWRATAQKFENCSSCTQQHSY
jgi:hypothetical protein